MKKLKDFLVKYKYWISCLAGIGIVFDIFVLIAVSDLVHFFLILIWTFSLWLNKLKGKISILAGLILIAICPFLIILGKKLIVEKAAIWAYLLISIGILKELFARFTKK